MLYEIGDLILRHPDNPRKRMMPGDVVEIDPADLLPNWTDPEYTAKAGVPFIIREYVKPIESAAPSPVDQAAGKAPPVADSSGVEGDDIEAPKPTSESVAPAAESDSDVAEDDDSLPTLPEDFDSLEFPAVLEIATAHGLSVGNRASDPDKLRARIRAARGE